MFIFEQDIIFLKPKIKNWLQTIKLINYYNKIKIIKI